MSDRVLTDADVDAIAHRVLALIPPAPEPAALLDTAAVAALIHVGPDWVRDHAAELGGIRIGDGPRGELRFETERVAAAMERRRIKAAPEPQPRRRPGRRQQPRDAVELIELPRWAA